MKKNIYMLCFANFKKADPTLYSQTKPVLESQTNDKLYYVYKKLLYKIIHNR